MSDKQTKSLADQLRDALMKEQWLDAARKEGFTKSQAEFLFEWFLIVGERSAQ